MKVAKLVPIVIIALCIFIFLLLRSIDFTSNEDINEDVDNSVVADFKTEVPDGWRVPGSLYVNYDNSIVNMLSKVSSEVNLKFQYMFYCHFIDSMKDVICLDAVASPLVIGNSAVEGFYFVNKSSGEKYFIGTDSDATYAVNFGIDESFLSVNESVKSNAENTRILLSVTVPASWEPSTDVVNTYNLDIISLLNTLDEKDSTKLQYIMFSYFGDDLSNVLCDTKKYVMQTIDDTEYSGIMVRCGGIYYFIWWDDTYGYICYAE